MLMPRVLVALADSFAFLQSSAGLVTPGSVLRHLTARQLYVAAIGSDTLPGVNTQQHILYPLLAHAVTSYSHAVNQSQRLLSTSSQSTAAKSVARTCQSCHHGVMRGSFACQGCDKLQPVDDSLNYFELLGMPNMTFDVSLAKLDQQYKLLQWSLHPDKVVSRKPDEQVIAAEQAALVNHAYTVLKKPLYRANYLLAQHGIMVGKQAEGTIDGQELLMEVLEAREEVDSTEDSSQLRALLAGNRDKQARVVAQLSAAFKAAALKEAASLTTQLTYLVRLEEDIVAKLPDCG
ncbi:Co-chaperone [Haematococcus lacustris]